MTDFNIGFYNLFYLVDEVKSPDECLEGACLGGHLDLAKYMVEKGANIWNRGLTRACEGGNLTLINYMIEKGANDWNNALYGACKGGHWRDAKHPTRLSSRGREPLVSSEGRDLWSPDQPSCDLVTYLLGKYTISLCSGLAGACRGGHLELVKFLVEKGANNWDWGLAHACRGGHLDLAKYMVEQGAIDWNWGMQNACLEGHFELVKFLVEKGTPDLNQGLYYACQRNDWGDIIDLLHSDVYKSVYGIDKDVIQPSSDIVRYLIEKGATKCSMCNKSMQEHLH